jgi:hypothetical protein
LELPRTERLPHVHAFRWLEDTRDHGSTCRLVGVEWFGRCDRLTLHRGQMEYRISSHAGRKRAGRVEAAMATRVSDREEFVTDWIDQYLSTAFAREQFRREIYFRP